MPAHHPHCLSGSLTAHLRRLAERQPDHEFAFIVTLQPGAKAAKVLPFAPTVEVELIRMAAGSMTAAQALKLADDPRVERIELDGEAHTLPSSADEPND
jgi:hypothetical protein